MTIYKYQKIILSLLLVSFHTSLFAKEVIYQCTLPQEKEVAIFLVDGIPQYQYGNQYREPNTQPEITLPTTLGDTSKIHYADVDESPLFNTRYYRFTNADYNYVVYSSWGYTNMGHGAPWENGYLKIFKGDKKIKEIQCITINYTHNNSDYDPSKNLQEDSIEVQQLFHS